MARLGLRRALDQRAGRAGRTCRRPTDYIDRVAAGASLEAERRVDVRTASGWRTRCLPGLRLTAGVDVERAARRYGIDAWDRYGERLQPFFDGGLLFREGPILRLSRDGMLVANEIMQVFV